ncbi:MAG TPA: hypothetical protein VFJ85_13390 [Acidimicrobiales bacterium]|nr:hypothetical protein [Acidimicrobiales bacterium]
MAVDRVRGAYLATLVLVALAAGCGREEKQASISKPEFVKEANAICARGNEAMANAAPPAAAGDVEAATAFSRVFVPNVRNQIREIRALGFPKGDVHTLDALFTDAESLLRRAEQDPASLDGHAFDDVNARLTAYGLWVCGS